MPRRVWKAEKRTLTAKKTHEYADAGGRLAYTQKQHNKHDENGGAFKCRGVFGKQKRERSLPIKQ